ncbi:unnamed protein product, partial [Closterium sp. NIES-53]
MFLRVAAKRQTRCAPLAGAIIAPQLSAFLSAPSASATSSSAALLTPAVACRPPISEDHASVSNWGFCSVNDGAGAFPVKVPRQPAGWRGFSASASAAASSLTGSPAGAPSAAPAASEGDVPRVKLLIGGKLVDSTSDQHVPVINPATQEVLAHLPLATRGEFSAAVRAAADAFPAWRATPLPVRARVMLKLQELIRREMDRLALSVTTEQGKTLADARGDVFRGLEVVEQACAMGTMQMGELLENVSAGVDTYSIRQPLGVCAGICPFNFPAMIPLWMFPFAVTAGNTFILKPSEKDPGAAMMLAELALEAGLPAGVLNVVHGTHVSGSGGGAQCSHLALEAGLPPGVLNVVHGTHVSGIDGDGGGAGDGDGSNIAADTAVHGLIGRLLTQLTDSAPFPALAHCCAMPRHAMSCYVVMCCRAMPCHALLSQDVVNWMCDEPEIRAISFVGSDKHLSITSPSPLILSSSLLLSYPRSSSHLLVFTSPWQLCMHLSFVPCPPVQAGRHIYARAASHGKRVQCNMGAKNHAVVLPDADPQAAVNALVGAAFGAAGQRCMAISTAVFVGGSQQ